MKNTFLKCLIGLGIILSSTLKAQITTEEYIQYYNEITPKLESIVPYKTNFYHQNFSEFYNELLSKNITIVRVGMHEKDGIVRNELNRLTLRFTDTTVSHWALRQSYRNPVIWITLEEILPYQEAIQLKNNYYVYWNQAYADFFANRKIKSIRFMSLNGYDSTDFTSK